VLRTRRNLHRLAVLAREAGRTPALIGRHAIEALAPVLARIRQTLVLVDLTLLAFPAQLADTPVLEITHQTANA